MMHSPFSILAGLLLAWAVTAATLPAVARAAESLPPDQCLRPAEHEQPQVVGVYLSMGYWDAREVEQVFDELEQCGVNLVIDYALDLPEDDKWVDDLEFYLNTAQQHHIGVAFVLYPLLKGMTPLNANRYYDKVAEAVAELRQYPAITAWYVHDEVLPWITDAPEQDDYIITLNGMQQLYQRIREADPTRPQMCVWNHLPSFESFHNVYQGANAPHGMPKFVEDEQSYEDALATMLRHTCDIVLIDSYPVDAAWREDDLPADQIVRDILTRANGLKDPQQPLYLIFQAFSWAQYNPQQCKLARFPTISEMQEMLAAARSCGASGAIAYSWFDLAEDGIDGRDISGRAQALDNLKVVLASLANTGWPTPVAVATTAGIPQANP